MVDATPAPSGRRERHAREKRERILAAATALFDERGFDAVTTQGVAERADVAVGTLFRYAATKGELFLMVYNEQLARAIADGAAASAAHDDPAEAVFLMVRPVLLGTRAADTAAVYQRELLFGPPDGPYRGQGLSLVEDLQRRIAERLLAAVPVSASPRDDDDVRRAARRAARTVFAVLNLLLMQPLADERPGDDRAEELRAQVEQVVLGFLAAVAG